jgi:hypothetical protein
VEELLNRITKDQKSTDNAAINISPKLYRNRTSKAARRSAPFPRIYAFSRRNRPRTHIQCRAALKSCSSVLKVPLEIC